MDIQHKYFKLLVNLCIDNLWDRIIKISSDNCTGCEIDHPSQVEHSCLMDSLHMKLTVNFEIAYMWLDIRKILKHMIYNYECERGEVKTLWNVMKTYSSTDYWKNGLFLKMEQQAKYHYI